MAEVLQEPICNATWVATGDDKEQRCSAPRHPSVAEDAMNKKRICCPSRCSSRVLYEMYRCIYTNRICARRARYKEGDAAPTEFMSTSCVGANRIHVYKLRRRKWECALRTCHKPDKHSLFLLHCIFFLQTGCSALLSSPRGFMRATNHRTVPPDDVRFVTLWVVVHL